MSSGIKFGSAVDHDKNVNCGKCGLRDRCRDKRKSRNFACTFFLAQDFTDKKLDPSSKAFAELMRELVKSESILADPFNIDDRDCKLAPNFYEWCVGENYLASDPRPFPWQLEVGLHLFNDICPNPKCSDPDWFDYIPHDCDVEEIPERLTLREYGVCPKCGRNRLQYLRKGLQKDYNAFIGILGQRCVTGDTLVTTSSGLTRIKDWLPRNAKTGWNTGKFYLRKRKRSFITCLETGTRVEATKFWVSKPEHVYRVQVRGGLEIKGTADHPIKTFNGWTPLKNVKVGDIVPVWFNQNVWGASRLLTPDTARLLGFWVSEGSGSKNAVHITNYDHEVLAACKRAMLTLVPNAEIKERNREGIDPKLGLKRCVGSRDPQLYKVVNKLADGLWRKSADKVIPRSVLESPKEVVCSFLQALFEGDGSAGKKGVGYASLSRELVYQLQVVLANMGIISSIRKRWSWATNGTEKQVSKPYWCLIIRGSSLRAYQENISFFSKRKRDALAKAIARFENVQNLVPTWDECYPDVIKKEYLSLIGEIDAEWATIRNYRSDDALTRGPLKFRGVVEDWRRLLCDNVALSRSRLSRYWQKLQDSQHWYDLSESLRSRVSAFHDKYLNPNCYWTVVRSVEKSSKKHTTYDIHVPNHHRFMANGLLNHNSGKCISGDTLVSTPKGLRPIKCLAVDDKIVLHKKEHRVLASKATQDKPTIRLLTRRGYDITLTADHPLLTPIGFARASKAKEVLIESYYTEWPESYDTIFSLEKKRGIEVATQLSKVTQSQFLDVWTRHVKKEFVHDNEVVIEFASENLASGFQTFLLSKSIICARSGKRFLRFSNPWLARLSSLVSLTTPTAKFLAENATPNNVVPIAARNAIISAINSQNIDNENHPSLLKALGVYRQYLREGSFSKEDASAMRRVLVELRGDFLLKTTLINLLDVAINSDATWDEVALRSPARKTTVYDIEVEDSHVFVANGIVSHNSTGLSYVLSYHEHQLLKLKNPSAFYRIKAATVLKTTIVGLNYSGAKQNVYEPLMATKADAPWYKLYHEVLDAAAKRLGEDELYRIKDTYMLYRNAALYTSPNAPSRRNLRGATRIAGIVDEISHFSSDTKLVNLSGMEVWRALSRSLNTIRPAVNRLRERGVVCIPPALMAGISSPFEKSDPGMQLYNAAPRQSGVYYILRPTWEANPTIKKKDLADEFKLDPVSAWRDLGCRPPYSSSVFVAGIEPFKSVIDRRSQNAVVTKTITVKKNNRAVSVSAKIKRWRWVDSTVPKLLAFDAGEKNNAFAMCLAHVNEDDTLVYDAFIEIRPRDRLPVSHRRVYKDLIVPIVKAMNVVVAVGDRWQHIRLMEDLDDDHDVPYIPVRLKYAHFTAWRDDLLRGQFLMPKPEHTAKQILNVVRDEISAFDDCGVSQFVRQSIKVVDVPGRTVDKPVIGNDDVFRTGVLAHAALGFTEVVDLLAAGNVEKRSGGPLGAVALGASPRAARDAPNVGVLASQVGIIA